MRQADKPKESQRDFAERAGINYGKVQRLESRVQPTLMVDDMAAWLNTCGSTMSIYFGQLTMTNELKILNEDLDIVEKFKRALKIPTKRTVIKSVLDGLFPDEEPPGKKSKQRSARRPSPSGAHGGE